MTLPLLATRDVTGSHDHTAPASTTATTKPAATRPTVRPVGGRQMRAAAAAEVTSATAGAASPCRSKLGTKPTNATPAASTETPKGRTNASWRVTANTTRPTTPAIAAARHNVVAAPSKHTVTAARRTHNGNVGRVTARATPTIAKQAVALA